MTKTTTKLTFAWDSIDPVANAILELITTQQAVQNAHNADATGDGDDDALAAAIDARSAAVAQLIAAESEYWRQYARFGGLTG